MQPTINQSFSDLPQNDSGMLVLSTVMLYNQNKSRVFSWVNLSQSGPIY